VPGKKPLIKATSFGNWKARDEGLGFVATCDRCGGKLTVSGESKLFLVFSDPFMGLDFCPGDNPDLMMNWLSASPNAMPFSSEKLRRNGKERVVEPNDINSGFSCFYFLIMGR